MSFSMIIQTGLVLFVMTEVSPLPDSFLLFFKRLLQNNVYSYTIIHCLDWICSGRLLQLTFRFSRYIGIQFGTQTFPLIANLRNGDSFFCLRIYGSVGRGSGDRERDDDISDRTTKYSVLSATPVEIPGF